MKLNNKEKTIIASVLGCWGIILISSGIVMNSKNKPVIHTKYTLDISERKIAETQAKTNEIKLKDIPIEINNPISVDVRDYLDNLENLNEETIKSLKLDTSRVNINEAGKYQYIVSYKKKKYLASVIVKEKVLPNIQFTLKDISITINEALSQNPSSYIKETLTDEILNNITLDLSEVDTTKPQNYNYYIIYNNTKYQGKITVNEPSATIITRPPQKEEIDNKKEETNTPDSEQNNNDNTSNIKPE